MKKSVTRLEERITNLTSVSVLRLVLLGKSVLENRRVGNFILGKAAFDVKATTALVEQHSEKVRGHVQGRPITVINTPDLFHPQLSHHQLSVAVKECASLSAPGPHVFILVLQPDSFTEEDRHHVTAIMNKFGTEAMNYTIVLTTGKSPIHARAWDVNKSGPVQAIIRSCSMRHHVFNNLYRFDRHQVLQLIEKIDQMLEENGGPYFSCEQSKQISHVNKPTVKRKPVDLTWGKEKLHNTRRDTWTREQENSNKEEGDEKNEKVSVLRLVLLGKSVLENRTVGNFILGKAAFDVKATTALVEQHNERVRGHVQGRPMKVVNTPDLFHPQLSHHQLSVAVKECVSLSAPGPHVFILVLQPDSFTEEDRHHVTAIMNKFGTEAMNYTIVLTTGKSPIHARAWDVNKSGPVQAIIRSCSMRHHVFNNLYRFDRHQVLQLIEKIDRMLEENGGPYFSCEQSKQISEGTVQHVNKPGREEGDEKNEKDLQRCDFTVALIGSDAAVKYGGENILLGEEELYLDQSDLCQITPKTKEVSGRHVSVINMLGLHELPQQSTDTHISHLLRDHEIHVFLYVLPLGLLTDEDKMGLEWLQRTFGEKSLDVVMILFTYETEDQKDTVIDDLKKNAILEQIVQKCGGRYHTCDKSMNNQSEMRTLLEKIDRLVCENKGCYRLKTYNGEQKKMQKLKQHNQNPTINKGNKSSSEPKTELQEEISKEREERINEEAKRPEIQDLMNRLNLKGHLQHKLTTADVLEINRLLFEIKKSQTETDLVDIFLQKLLTMDYRARYTVIREKNTQIDLTKPCTENVNEEMGDGGDFDALMNVRNSDDYENREQSNIHPMDVQMAVFHCADKFLQQFMVTKLSQCQYALPLLVPNPFTQQIEFPLWTFRQIKKSWTVTDISCKAASRTKPVYKAETPMVSFVRLGPVASSKSQLMNSLINEKHNTFFHRHCPGSSKTRLLMDGVVEIAWYCPSGKDTDHFTDCVAFCNLHGDAEVYEKQREILTEKASVNVVLYPDLDEKGKTLLQRLYSSQTPLICLLSENNSTVTRIKAGKYRMGLKDRNQSEVSAELGSAIRECLSMTPHTFKVEDMARDTQIRVDEEDEDCKRGKKAALQILNLLEGEELSSIKQKYLPCQGKLWHDWCQKNKKLHRLQEYNTEMNNSKIQTEMKALRNTQRQCNVSELIRLFTQGLCSLTKNGKTFFLKWLGILLDDLTTEKLSDLHYDTEQAKLEKISDKLCVATFGLEHIVREAGQIYEAWASVKKTKGLRDDTGLSYLPALAAELMMSGHPMELMDGDAAHVPLIWVTAVLDEVIKRLGDQRVFVLSVLGIQSTGKSTMLNAMFGLQFAVSAGRCTRGAFMQLVRVTEEMKEELKFDYILVVDTEGLRALELAGRSTQHHDNELATFVVGLGNMTLINIFGENPADMQDILQIVVQAFLRMKKVRLSPSCVFVHQNVGDIRAGEKNMEGKRRLQEKLDEMTKLAAKEEDSNAECFSDVIAFDVKRDVKYFAQLWEGSPPMAPPNPSYSENIQELKRHILSQSSKSSGMTLSQFKTTICNLWNALLNENFVFSFKNTQEIAVYRKLETQYGKWAWSLRSAMLTIENKLQNRIENEKLTDVEEKELVLGMRKTKEEVDKSVKQYFEEDGDKDILIQWRGRFENKICELYDELMKETRRKLNELIEQKKACKKLNEKKVEYEKRLFEMSKELALSLKNKEHNENVLRKKFDEVWSKWVTDLTKDTPLVKDINVWQDVIRILCEQYERSLVCEREEMKDYKHLSHIGNYSDYIIYKNKFKPSKQKPSKRAVLSMEDQSSIKAFINATIKKTERNIKTKPITRLGYHHSYIQEITDSVRQNVKEYESGLEEYVFKKEFTVDLSLCVCDLAAQEFTQLHKEFKNSNDARAYLENQKPQYYSVFKNSCKGATSTAVFGEFICSKLEPSILQAVYDKTAIDLAHEMKSNASAFNGNRSNLEKHILRSLAAEEKFQKFMIYIHNPEKHFKQFITKEVNKYILQKNNQTVLGIIIGNLKLKQQCIISAVHSATQEVKNNCGDANKWLSSFSDRLKDELKFTEKSGADLKDVKDFIFLEKVIKEGLDKIKNKLEKNFKGSPLKMEMFRERPEEILIKHFCRCCWVQCPFCKAICTNTIEGHPGDHSVPFHRSPAVNGVSYRDTTYFSLAFCTTQVASDNSFYPSSESNEKFPYKEYRKAGPWFADWSITPDLSELAYWKWFVSHFQTNLEKHYNFTFQNLGEIPKEWREYTKQDAFDSLDKYI
ncbi:interferon-induced very large GTPase 1-like [Chanos chanos]|uniref:Interferon-induced very large GTPase 1-like n=1 Tax=Chanos chanos TaxID=29144 RepID=A0A6J2WYC6_CHACN|nr:interferon-induced very large GTPase 1-like [Chanos chanos]